MVLTPGWSRRLRRRAPSRRSGRAAGGLSRRPSRSRRCPCRPCGRGRAPRGRARSPRRAGRRWAPSRSQTSSYSSDSPSTGRPVRKSRAVTCSPVVTMAPASMASTSRAKSSPRKCARTVSAVAVRSRWVRISSSRPSSPRLELDLAAEHVDRGLEVDDAGDGVVLALTVARWMAAAAIVSAPAIAKRAETPERWSTEDDSRSLRVKRARISTRESGTSTRSAAVRPPDGSPRSRPPARSGSGCGSRRRNGP